MRLISLPLSLLVVLSFLFPWFRVDGERITFIEVLRSTLFGSDGLTFSLSWLNPDSNGGIIAFILFLIALLLILLGILYGLRGGRTGPALGVLGMLIFTLVLWYIHGPGYLKVIDKGYVMAFLSFTAGLLLAGGEKL
ncbi:amino acid permease [Thermococcus sp. P6]|uniref:amino acid permease n=1 Tax=Thermococcus sp. P6 TaxID=122420 RepID=UPI000B5A1B9A|nr:amino acid permease [Thermococcus sp. P6]ASJ09975.1 amino acid permease [Thermococcus sp. P6]